MNKATPIPTAHEIMKRRPDTVSGELDIKKAIRWLLKKGYSGAPVVDESEKLVGVLSEHDCIKLLAQAAAERWPLGRVSEHMTKEVETVGPSEDIFALSTRFGRGLHRRLFVVEDDKLVGVIGRKDILRALESLEKRVEHKHEHSTYEEIEKRHISLD